MIPNQKQNLVPGSMATKTKIAGLEIPQQLCCLLTSLDDIIAERIKQKQKVTINLYFGFDADRQAREEKLYGKVGDTRFANWAELKWK